MNLREINLNDIGWVSKKTRRNENADITVTLCKDGCVSITFRNDVIDTLSATGYAQVGIIGSALLFKEADAYEGYKLSHNKSKNGNKNMQISDERIALWAKKYAGDYTAKLFKTYIYIDGEPSKK